ncbi:hypothetical protein GF357_00125 [Candidatus Dojkabacteria bacterium]|nr:hypothetical protein [Candidatus Dojkabacteria bacterium]
MGKEIEAKFININKENLQKKLAKIGAKKVFDERLLRRCVYNLPIEKDGAWARVRDEVDKVTMTYKRVTDKSLDGVEEVELIVDSFDKAREFLKSVGLFEKAYQETKRIRYVIESDNVEFDIDTWPGLSPWVEIEADSKEFVKKYSGLLGFDWNDAMFGSADFVYEKIYKIDANWINNECPVLKFGDLPKELQETNLR